MGFTRPSRRAEVKINSGDYAGLVLGLSLSVSLGELINFQRLRFGDGASLETQAEAMDWFGENVLLDWNLEEDDGTPVPADLKGWNSIEPALAFVIVNKWREVVTEVEAPLETPSSGGSSSGVDTTTRRESRSRSRKR